MPIYEYRCEECGKRSSTLLASYSSQDPPCPHCGKPALRRLVSTFATTGGGEVEGGGEGDDYAARDEDDFGVDGDDDFGRGEDDF